MPSKAFLRRIRLIPPIARTAAKPASRNDCPQNPPVRWHCAARREITERSEEAPAAEAAQPSRDVGSWKALEGQSVGVEICDKPSGVVRGECRGGLGGAAAPNRPPSAARRAGGPNKNNGKALVPAGHTSRHPTDKPCFSSSRSASDKNPSPRRPPHRPPKLKQPCKPALRGHNYIIQPTPQRHIHKIPTIPPFKQNKRRPQHTGAAFAYFHFRQTASRNTAMRQPTHLFQIDNPHIPTGFINLFTETLPAVFAIYKPCQPFRHMQHRMLVMHIDEAAGNANLA